MHAPQVGPQWLASVRVFWQVPEQLVWVALQVHAPAVEHVPPDGVVHEPDVRGVALHAVDVPEHTMEPVWAHPPEPDEVHEPPVAWHTPEQLVVPEHTQSPALLQVPPVGEEQLPEVRGPTLHAVVVPEHTTVPVWAHPPEPAETHEAPVARHTPPQLV